MIKLKTILSSVIMVVMILFTSIGYARVSDSFSFNGTVTAERVNDIYISNASVKSGNVTINAYAGTTINSTVTLGGATSTAIMSITITNNSETDKVFNVAKPVENEYSNQNIKFTLEGITTGTPIHSYKDGENYELTFNVIFSYAGSNTTNPNLTSLLYFEFAEEATWDPSHDDDDDGGGSGGNGGGEVEVVVGEDFAMLIQASLSSIKNSYGLNDPNKGQNVENAILGSGNTDGILYSTDNISGGNIKHFASKETNAYKLDFMFERSTDTEIMLYMWRLEDVTKAEPYMGVMEILVYKQAYHLVNNEWVKSVTMQGRALLQYVDNNQGNEIIAPKISSWKPGAPPTTNETTN